MKTVVIYFSSAEKMGPPFNEEVYFHSYKRLCSQLEQAGFSVHIARGDSYQGNMTFSPTCKFSTDGNLEEVPEGCTASVLYLKGYALLEKLTDSNPVVNPLALTAIAHDKWKTYETFESFMAKSVLLPLNPTTEQLAEALAHIPTDLVVTKPRFGHGGNGVQVLPKTSLTPSQLEEGVEYFLQAFIDASMGIPNITNGNHDLRIIVTDSDQPLLTFVRTPKVDGYVSNLYQGGTLTVVASNLLPSSVLSLVTSVREKLSTYGPSFYAIDVMVENGKPYICEINSQPGMGIREIHGEAFEETYHRNLIATLTEAVQHHA